MRDVTIIGTGKMAAAIGGLAVAAGHVCEVIGRDAEKTRRLADRLGGRATAGVVGHSPAAEIVILAVPYPSALDMVALLGPALASKIIVDITNPIKPDLSGFLTHAGSSGAREIAAAADPRAALVKAFNTLPSDALADGAISNRTLDVFLAGDDLRAKQRVSAFVSSLGLRPLDTGPLTMAWALEHACMTWLGIMTHSIHHPAFALTIDPVV